MPTDAEAPNLGKDAEESKGDKSDDNNNSKEKLEQEIKTGGK